MFFRRIIALIFFLFVFFCKNTCCAENLKIKDLVIDNSDSLVLIRGVGNYLNSNTDIYVPIPNENKNENTGKNSINLINNITTIKLNNPPGFVVDIPNATLNGGSRYYQVKNSKVISRIDMLQFDTNIVRIVFTLINEKDLNNFKVFSDEQNIIVKYSNQIVSNSIQHKFYTISGDMDKNIKPQNVSTDIIFNSNNHKTEIITKLQNKFFLSSVSDTNKGLVLKGVGELSFQKTKYFDNNTRAEIVLDNANLLPSLENKTFYVPDVNSNIKTTLSLNKINDKKIKLTLMGESLRDYRIIISPDNQSFFISHRKNVLDMPFALSNTNLLSYNITKNSDGYYIFDIKFDKPIAYDIFELNDDYYLDIDNLVDFKEVLFKQALKKTDLNIQPMKISKDKMRYIISAKNLNLAYGNIESNSKSIKLCFKEKPQQPKQNAENVVVLPPVNDTNKNKTSEMTISSSTILQKDEEKSGNINVVYVPKEDNSKIIFKEPRRKKQDTSISSLKKVVLDPGHGGVDPGAIGGGVVYEKNLNLIVAKMIEEKLKKKNVHVYMTRDTDEFVSLENRTLMSNEISPDIYVSLHANSTVQDNIYGLEVHYYKDDSLELANTINSVFASEKNLKKWDTKDRGVIKSRFYVINHTEAPSVLIEIGFISNRVEREKLLLKQRQEEIANSIADAILEYLKVKK